MSNWPYAAVPQILKDLPNWVVWKKEKRNGKWTKVPYDAKEAGESVCAKSNDTSTWAAFDVAVEAADPLNGSDYDGVGFMLQGTPFIGVDFDGVLRDGKAEPIVLEILKHLGGAYAEVTPSLGGLRVFIECPALPKGGRKFSGSGYGAEIYSGAEGEGGRYLTVTGNKFSGEGVPKITDVSLPYLLISQIRHEKFKKLWMGDLSDYHNDHSSADCALMWRLAKLLNCDAEQMERIFGASKLGQREKWTKRKDYRERTIRFAILHAKETKEPEATGTKEAVLAGEPILTSATSIRPEKVKWLWMKRVALGKITLFAGNPDNGKSLAALSLVSACTTGMAFPDSPNANPPSEVILLLGEDDLADTAVPRLMAAGADVSKVHFLQAISRSDDPEAEVRLDADLSAVEKCLDEHPSVRLLVIDPISNYLGDTSMIAEQEIRREILIPLKKLAARRRIAIVLIMHLNKKSDLSAINRVGGAMAFIGVARSSWLFNRDAASEDGRLPDSFTMARIKNNLVAASTGGLAFSVKVRPVPIEGEPEPALFPYVVWGGVVHKSADDVLDSQRKAGRPTSEGESKLQQAVEWLQAILQDGPVDRKILKERAKEEKNISDGTLRRAQEKLGIKPYKKGRRWVWELPRMNATGGPITDPGDIQLGMIQ